MDNIIDCTDRFGKIRKIEHKKLADQKPSGVPTVDKSLEERRKSDDLGARIDRIKSSIVRINQLMNELKQMDPKKPC